MSLVSARAEVGEEDPQAQACGGGHGEDGQVEEEHHQGGHHV